MIDIDIKVWTLFVSFQGVDTVPTSTLRALAFLAQHPYHSLET